MGWGLWRGTPGAAAPFLGSRAGRCSSCFLEAGVRSAQEGIASVPGSLRAILSHLCLLMPYLLERGSEHGRSSCPQRPLMLQPGSLFACTSSGSCTHPHSRSAKCFPRGTPQAGAGMDLQSPARKIQNRHFVSLPLLLEGGQGSAMFHPPRSDLCCLPAVPCLWHRHSPLCCRKPWFGILRGERGTGAPQEQPCVLQMEPGLETLLLLPSQAPLSACHQNSIPSASPAVFGHSLLRPPQEQFVVAASVSVCRVREGWGRRGHLNSFCS